MELEFPKVENDESNTHEIHLNSSAIDQEIEEVPIESLAAPDNKNSSIKVTGANLKHVSKMVITSPSLA